MSGTRGGSIGPADRYASQGMVSTLQFVYPSGDLTALSFRFLHGMFSAIRELQGTVVTLQSEVAALRGSQEPPP